MKIQEKQNIETVAHPVEAAAMTSSPIPTEKPADLRQLYASLREKHQFLQTLEKQGVAVPDLQTLRARTEHALNELQGIMAELGANV